MTLSPFELEIFQNVLSSIAEEMGMSLIRAGFSPNIKERRDLSCAIFDQKGEMIAQAAHIPVHLGSMSFAVKAILDQKEILEGDIFIINDPFNGGTHLPDITCIAPVFVKRSLLSFIFVENPALIKDIPISSAIELNTFRKISSSNGLRVIQSILQKGVLVFTVLKVVLISLIFI